MTDNLAKQQQDEEASLRERLALDERFIEAWLNRGRRLLREGDAEGAQQVALFLLELDASDTDALTLAARAALHRGLTGEARQYTEHMRQRACPESSWRVVEAEIELEVGNFPASAGLLAQVIDGEPGPWVADAHALAREGHRRSLGERN